VQPASEPTCGVCQSLSGDHREPALYEDDLWVVRPASPPGPAHFDDREARAFGPALRHFERVLECAAADGPPAAPPERE
jgi:hypothetical protein